MSIKKARKIQFGKETTKGTAVAATALFRSEGMYTDEREVEQVTEDIGYLSPVNRPIVPKIGAAIAIEETPVTFEQLPYLLAMGVKDVTSGSADGVGSDFIYTYPLSTVAPANDWRTYTIEMGNDQQAAEVEYCFAEKITIKGGAGEAVTMSADLRGRQVTNTTFTGAIAVPAVEELLFQKCKLYIDNSAGTIGTTQKTNTLIGFELTIETGLMAVWTGDGNLYFSFAKVAEPKVTLDVTFEYDGTAVAEMTNWRNKTKRLIQILGQGGAVVTPGTTYSVKTLKINLAGHWKSFDTIGDKDGNDIVKGTFAAAYVAADTLFATLIVVNELSALT